MSEHIGRSRAGAVLTLRIDRPAKKNALDHAMYAALDAALREAGDDPEIRTVLLEGSNGDFTAGNDLADFAAGPPEGGAPVHRLIETVIRLAKPLVAAVDGQAVGIGTTILLHCDIVIASSAARFRMPFVDLALVSEFASSLMLPRLVGRQKAAELLLLGRGFDAAEAERMGLVARVVAPDALAGAAMEAAAALAAKPPEALAITRRLLRGDIGPILARHEEETRLFTERLRSDEARGAFAAFLGRKK